MLKFILIKKITGKVQVNIKSGIKSINNKRLKKSYKKTIVFENLKPSVRFVGKGIILPDGNKLIVPFEAVNLKSVHKIASGTHRITIKLTCTQ